MRLLNSAFYSPFHGHIFQKPRRNKSRGYRVYAGVTRSNGHEPCRVNQLCARSCRREDTRREYMRDIEQFVSTASGMIEHDHNQDGIDRRGFLKCMAWAGGGALCVVEAGVLRSAAL